MALNNFIKGLIFHVPHSSDFIPDYKGILNRELAEQQSTLLTDYHTEKVFKHPEAYQLVFPFSRVYCDVERLSDDQEIMFKYGRGIYYTHSDEGILFRDQSNKGKVLEVYQIHHDSFNLKVETILADNGDCFIIDGHSFPDIPFMSDIDKTLDRPDFCLGHNNDPMGIWLVEKTEQFLRNRNFSVWVNRPYSGSILPNKFFQNERVHSFMIEINRKHLQNKPLQWIGMNLLIKELVHYLDKEFI